MIAGVTVLGLSVIWHQLKNQEFFQHVFYMAHIFYSLGMIQSLDLVMLSIDPWLRVFIFLGGIVMVYVLFNQTKWVTAAYIMGIYSLLFLLVSIYALHQSFDLSMPFVLSLQFTLVSVILFLIGYGCKNHFKQAFWWTAHVFLPIALLIEIFSAEETVLWAIIMTGVIYGVSLYKTKQPVLLHLFLYQLLNMVALTVVYFIWWLDVLTILKYNLLISIAIYAVVWFSVSDTWKKRLNFYIVPFSLSSLFLYSFMVSKHLLLFSLTCLLAAFISWFLLKVKWEIITLLPLGLCYISILNYSLPDTDLTYGLFIAFAVLLFIIGTLYFPTFYQSRREGLPVFDWFTCIGFMAILTLYPLAGTGIVDQLVADILIVIGLFIQKYRVKPAFSKWVLFATTVYILKPYYKLIDYFTISEYIITMLYVLPWVAIVGLLKRVAGSKYRKTMNYAEWGILVIAAVILVTDALQRSTIYDAIIIGTLALVSMLAGMQFRIKSYFFVGISVLLLNVFLQTKPFWGNLPWWMYLLIAGTLLIVIASLHEWYKKRLKEGKESLLINQFKKVIGKMKSWE